jgi:hypothetical protein
MSADAASALFRRFVDLSIELWRVSPPMRRQLDMSVAFAPTRLSADHLRVAYDIVMPIVERRIAKDTGDPAGEYEAVDEQSQNKRRGAR